MRKAACLPAQVAWQRLTVQGEGTFSGFEQHLTYCNCAIQVPFKMFKLVYISSQN